MRKLSTALAASFLLVLPVAFPSPAFAQNVPGKEHAKKLFEDGIELEKKSDYAGALTKYREAEQITATAGLRFHEGYCLEQTGKLSAALETYEAADKMARDQNKQDVHAAVVARLDPLRARVPQIAIRLATQVKDAEVQLDNVAVGAPLLDGTAFRLDPGEHLVTARAPGYKAFSRKVRVPEGVTTAVDVMLERAVGASVVPLPVAPGASAPAPAESPPPSAAPAGGSETEPPSEAPRSRSRVAPIVTTAGAIVLVGAGIGMFLVAGSNQSNAQRDCPTQLTCSGAQTRVRAFDALALGSFIGAAGLGVLSVVLWTSKAPESTAAVSPGAAARLVATPSSLGLDGTF